MIPNKKLDNSKHVAQVGHYNFGINYVNIRDRLRILNFEFQHL